jgi:hypothetical protein
MYIPDGGQFAQWIAESIKWIVAICVGILGKISYELTMKRKMGIVGWMAVTGISIFVGYLSAVWCVSNNMGKQGTFIVPVATLFGERITMYFAANFQNIMNRVVDAILNKKK